MKKTIESINRILEGLASCRLEFQESEKIDADLWSLEQLSHSANGELNGERKTGFVTSIDGKTAAYPIYRDRTLQGLAILIEKDPRKDIPRKDISEKKELLPLIDLVTSIIEHRLNQDVRSDSLHSFEERLEVQSSLRNVRPIRPTRLAQIQRSREELEKRIEQEQKSPLQAKGPVLIEDETDLGALQLALELHERSRRWAFLSLENLVIDTLDARENLAGLGAVTLYIRDLSLLSTKQQIRLAEYLASKPSDDMPQVIAATKPTDTTGRVLPSLVAMFIRSKTSDFGLTVQRKVDELIRTGLEPANKSGDAKMGRLIPFEARFLDPDLAPLH